eukprot:1493419-Amphidinium_carterae.1
MSYLATAVNYAKNNRVRIGGFSLGLCTGLRQKTSCSNQQKALVPSLLQLCHEARERLSAMKRREAIRCSAETAFAQLHADPHEDTQSQQQSNPRSLSSPPVAQSAQRVQEFPTHPDHSSCSVNPTSFNDASSRFDAPKGRIEMHWSLEVHILELG